MKVVCVANDLAPSNAFKKKIIPVLTQRGHEVTAFIASAGEEKTPVSEIVAAAENAQIVLLGMSSSPELAANELAAGATAVKAEVPIALFSDTFMPHRAWFADLEARAACAFVINERVAERGRPHYPVAELVVSGNPVWEDFFFPIFKREDVRAKIGIREKDVAILCPGGKVMEINNDLFKTAIRTATKLNNMSHREHHVFLSIHPNDKTDLSVYKKLTEESGALVSIMTKEFAETAELLVGSDIVVESMATTGVEAACQRKPVIDYLTERALDRLEKMTGGRTWDLCEEGAAYAVYEKDHQKVALGDPSMEIAAQAYRLLTKGCYSDGRQLREVQEKLFPEPKERGTAVRMIVDAMEKYARK